MRRESFGATKMHLSVLIEPFFEMEHPQAHPYPSLALDSRIDIAVAMRKPSIQRFKHFLSTRLGNRLECLGRFYRYIVVHHFSLDPRAGRISGHVMVDRRD